MNKGIFIILFVLLLITPFLGITSFTNIPVLASPSKITYSGESFWNMTGTGYYDYQQLDTKYVELLNGRLVCVYINQADSSYLRIKVINADGSTYGSADYTISSLYLLRDCSVYYVSDTVIYIGVVSQHQTTNHPMNFAMVLFNPSTLAVSSILATDVNLLGSGYNIIYAFLTTITTYNSKYYFMASIMAYDTVNGYKAFVYLMEYTVNTTLTAAQFSYTSGASSYAYPIYWFNYGGGIAYACWATDAIALSYYTVSLSAKTHTLLVAHNEPADTVDMVTVQYSHFLGGGLISNGTNRYLYFSWIRAHESAAVNFVTFVQERMIFNTTVTTANFIEYSRSALGVTLDYSGYETPTWCLGYEVDETQYKMYYPNNESGTTYMNRMIIDIDDWFDTASLSYTHVVGTTESLPDSINQQYPVSQLFTSQWGFCYDSTGIIIMYRLASLIEVYSVIGVISPNDSPYIQNKQYYLAISGKVNGVGRGGLAVNIIINSGLISTYGLSSLGLLSLPIKFSSTGVVTVQIDLIDVRVDTSIVATQTITGVVQSEDTTLPAGGSGGLISAMQSSWISTIINFSPIALVVFAPAGIGFIAVGAIGFVTGAMIGTILGVVAGVLPTYVLYMVFLILGILAIVVLRGGGNRD